ncbi:hypothetical protein ACRAWD_17945 [Caulobacter segnis]
MRDAIDRAATQALRAGEVIHRMRDFVAPRGQRARAREPVQADRGGLRPGFDR